MRKKLQIRFKKEVYSVTFSLISDKDWKKLYAFFKSNCLISPKTKFSDWKSLFASSEEILQYECKSKSEYDLLILKIKNLVF